MQQLKKIANYKDCKLQGSITKSNWGIPEPKITGIKIKDSTSQKTGEDDQVSLFITLQTITKDVSQAEILFDVYRIISDPKFFDMITGTTIDFNSTGKNNNL